MWIDLEQHRRHPRLDLFGDERKRCEQGLMNAEQLLSTITNITIDDADLILDHVFDNVGFNRIGDEIFRKLVKARLSYPASKAATAEAPYRSRHKRWAYPKDIGRPHRSVVLRRDHALF